MRVFDILSWFWVPSYIFSQNSFPAVPSTEGPLAAYMTDSLFLFCYLLILFLATMLEGFGAYRMLHRKTYTPIYSLFLIALFYRSYQYTLPFPSLSLSFCVAVLLLKVLEVVSAFRDISMTHNRTGILIELLLSARLSFWDFFP